MKKIVLILICMFLNITYSQTTYTWETSAPDGNWRRGINNGPRWQPGNLWDQPDTGAIFLHFNNNHQLTMTNNVSGTYNIYGILFGSNNTDTRTIGGNTIRFFDNSGADPKIENQSSGSHLFTLNIEGDGDAGDPLEINPVSGNLTFDGTVNNMGSNILIFGNNSHRARFNGVISGNAGFMIRQNSIAIFNAINTYSGNTELDNGELWIETTGDAIANNDIFLGNGGQLGNTCKIFLSRVAGGTTFSRNININPGNDNRRFLGGLNSSGTNTFSGNILRSGSGRPLTIQVVSAGGTVAFTGVINGSDNITKTGPGTMQLGTNDSTMTGSWLVEDGTLLTDNFPARLNARPITLGTTTTTGQLRITETSGNYNGNVAINSFGGTVNFNSSSNRNLSGTYTHTGNFRVINSGSTNLTFSGVHSGAGGITIASTGAGAVVFFDTSNTYTGITRIDSGILALANSNTIPSTSNIVLGGGTLAASTTTAGFSNNFGTLNLQASSTINLATGTTTHTFTFANSSGVSWNSSAVLTINNWVGTPTASGGAISGKGKIQVGVGGLSTSQLNQVQFTGFETGAVITASGELVPKGFVIYYSKGSLAPEVLTNWSSTPDGTGASPADFTSTARYVIQNGHTMTTSAAWTISGTDSTLQIENGGTLVSTFAVTMPPTGTFQIDNGGLYKHDNTTAWGSSIFQGTEVFGNSSTVEINKTNTTMPTLASFGNLIIDLSTDPGQGMNFSGNLTTVNGNFIVKHTRGRQVRLAAGAGTTVTVVGNFEVHPNADFAIVTGSANIFLNVDGNINLVGGTFSLATSTGVGFLVARGPSVTISENVTFAGLLPGTTGFYFNRNVEQTLNIAQPFTTGNHRNRFYVSTANSQPINEVYNGVAAQETINGTGATPGAGWAAWPTSGTAIKNFTVSNAAGVTLRNNRLVNNDLTINGGHLIVGSNITLQINNNFANNSGTATFENNSTLLQNNNNVNTADITYKRTATNIDGFDYVFWSSPVEGQSVGSIHLDPGPIFVWNTLAPNSNGASGNTSQGAWQSASGAMEPAKGYIIRGSSNFSATNMTLNSSFIGKPNNGNIGAVIVRGDFQGTNYNGANGVQITNLDDNHNLIGNPYPSAIRASEFITLNTYDATLNPNGKLLGTVKLWQHGAAPSNTNTNPFYGTYTNNYANDYLTINSLGTLPYNGSEIIKAGQGFFVTMVDGPAVGTAANITANFTNAMRVDASGNPLDNSGFFRMATESTSNNEKSRIWLDLIQTTSNSSVANTLVGYFNQATNEYDSLYDAVTKLEIGNGLFSNIANKLYEIQGRATFTATDEVPLTIKINNAGNYKIGINAIDGLFLGNQDIFIKDNLLNVYHNIKLSPYAFDTVNGVFGDRFKIVYQNPLSNTTTNLETVNIFKNENVIYANAKENIKSVKIFDISGRVLATNNNVNNTQFTYNTESFAHGVLIIQVTTEDGKVSTKKVL